MDRSLLTLLLLAFTTRCAAVVLRYDCLSVDRDAYLAIAENLQAGHGFCSVAGQPTAFRPPLYPVVLAVCLALGGTPAIAGLQIVLGTVTVGLTWRLARNAGFSRQAALVAGCLTAVDPLLLDYTAQAMTETLFTCLSTALLCSLTAPSGVSLNQPIRSGFLFGLAALCRPGIWVFGMTLAAAAVGRGMIHWCRGTQTRLERNSTNRLRRLSAVGLLVLTVLVTVSPWVIRNWLVFGRPILMTTHGGYTLALGNNRYFYEDVVSGSETVWSLTGLQRWQRESERQLAEAGLVTAGETARDAGLSRQAVEWMRENPRKFARACWLRLGRFWGISPAGDLPGGDWLRGLIRVWYASVFAAAVTGLIRQNRRLVSISAGLMLAGSLTLLHAVYWANMRMRCPVVPVIHVVAASVVCSREKPAVQVNCEGNSPD